MDKESKYKFFDVGTNKRIRMHLKLTYDMMIALIQGKNLHLNSINPEGVCEEFLITAPHDGHFMTHEQLMNIRSIAYQQGYVSGQKVLEEITKDYESEVEVKRTEENEK